MSHDNVNGKVNGDLISRRKLDGMRLAVPDFVNPDQRTKGWNECITYIQQKAPAVDAVPVVHARWVLHGNDDDCGSSYFCTNCGSGYDEDLFYFHEQYVPYLFCPHCGAKMGLGEGT